MAIEVMTNLLVSAPSGALEPEIARANLGRVRQVQRFTSRAKPWRSHDSGVCGVIGRAPCKRFVTESKGCSLSQRTAQGDGRRHHDLAPRGRGSVALAGRGSVVETEHDVRAIGKRPVALVQSEADRSWHIQRAALAGGLPRHREVDLELAVALGEAAVANPFVACITVDDDSLRVGEAEAIASV